MNRLILTDIDETVLEFANPFQDWATGKGFVNSTRLRDSYNVEKWLGVERSTALDLMAEFDLADSSYLSRAEPDALTVLPQLHQEGWRFVGITACGIDPVFAGRRINILAEVFGFAFEGVHFIEHRASKADILASFRPAIWVEDNASHAVTGANLGHMSFLLDREYNIYDDLSGVACLNRVRSWHDIYAVLNG